MGSNSITGSITSSIPWDEIDPLIRPALRVLVGAGFDTFGSCQGGEGHSSLMPEILFCTTDEAGGFRAVWALERAGFKAWELSWHCFFDGDTFNRYWRVMLRSGPGMA